MASKVRTGTEPATARSPLRLRLVLASFGAVACGLATIWLVALAREEDGTARTVVTVLCVISFAGAVVAVADAVVIIRRRRSGRR
jgi:Family of unknown function (DUF6343)